MAAVNKDLKEIERRKTRAVKRGDLAEASRLCNTAGELLSSHGMYYEAIEWHKEELTFSEAADDITGTAISHRKIGECCCELGQFGRALRHQKKQLWLAQSISNCVEEQRALATIGRTLFVQSDTCESEMEREKCLIESQEAYLNSLALCDKLKDGVSEKEILEMKARLCLNLGLVFEWRNNLDQAEKFMEKALISSRENNLKENMYRCYLSLSGVTARNNKLQESLRHAKRAQHLAKEKGNSAMEADAVLQIGQGLLKLGEFSAALQVIKQSYKLSPPELEPEQHTLMSTLKLAYRGGKYTKQLANCSSEEDRLTLYEKLGDVYGEAKSPNKALEYYQKQLELSQKLSKSSHTIAAIYVSLAITHAENREVEKALEYYNKELEIRTKAGYNKDFKETSATYSAIAKLQEDTGKDCDTVKEAYLKSLECAKKSGSISCQIRVSKELNQTYQKFGMVEEYEALKMKIEELELEKEESDDEEPQSVKEEDINVEHLLAPSDSSDEEGEEKRKTGAYRYSRRKLSKLNDKGETPLHLACINGNTNRVQELLEKGASVHIRDHCGWQPLHEACNFGHTEIVKLLLSYGANVIDPGGDHCGRVTPLHDASQNGHLETVQYLIKNGADPHFLDSKGRTPLDLVEKAIKADEDELDDSESDVLYNRRNVRQFLKEIMLKRKPNVPLRKRNVLDRVAEKDISDDDAYEDEARNVLSSKIAKANERVFERENQALDRRRSGEKMSQSISNFSSSSSNVVYQRNEEMKDLPCSGLPYIGDSLDKMDTDEDSTYASMDEDVLNPNLSPLKPLAPLTPAAGLGHEESSSTNDPGKPNPTHFMVMRSEIHSGSDSEAEPVIIDEFIVDDVGQRQATKKRRIDASSRKRTVQSTLPTLQVSRSDSSTTRRPTTSIKNSRSKLRKQTRLTTTYTPVNSPSINRGFSVNTAACNQRVGNSSYVSTSTHVSRTRDTNVAVSASGSPAIASIQRKSAQTSHSNLMRIRVRVEKELLLIPCADSTNKRTIEWLADQASQRYSSSIGMCPKLSLKTKEGALLGPDDFVSDVLLNNEEVQAVINGWNAGSLYEKYENECACLGIKKRDDIIDLLSPGDSLAHIKMADFNLKPQDLGALSKAFVGHSRLSRIDLTGNNVGNEGLNCLCSAIRYLPNLTCLILVCTGLTSTGLLCLSEALSLKYQFDNTQPNGGNTSHPLQELDCSYNSFGDSLHFLPALKAILKKCSRLKKLVFDHCCIHTPSQRDISFDVGLIASSNLQSLSFAGNPDISFINRLLPVLPATVQDLDLSGDSLSSPEFVGKLCDNLRKLIKSPRSGLCSLSLREINLEKPNSIVSLLGDSNLINQLHNLDISGSSVKDQRIYRSIAGIHSLKELDLSRSDNIDSKVAEFLVGCLATSESSLSILKMTSCEIQSLSGELIKNLGQCKFISHVDFSFNDTCYEDKQNLVDWWTSSHVNSEYCIEEDFCLLTNERTPSY